MATVQGKVSYILPPNITIIPGLKELSNRGLSEGCDSGKLGLTQENCVADVKQDEGKEPITKKRDNYTTTNTDKMPNHFLWDHDYGAPEELKDIFKLKKTDLKSIATASRSNHQQDYLDNWNNLFVTISELVEEEDRENIFICAHQYLLLHKFFPLYMNLKGGGTTPVYLKNCCCIKVELVKSKKADIIPVMSVFHEGEVTTLKHEYLSKDNQEPLTTLRQKGYVPLYIDPKYENLVGKTIYFIRHGEGYHNIIGKDFSNPYNIPGLKEIGKMMERRKRMYLNAMLTPEGVAQAQRLNAIFMENGVDLQPSIYISSPLDRAIETLITAVMYSAQFSALKTRFNKLQEMRYGKKAIAAAENPVVKGPEKKEQWEEVGNLVSKPLAFNGGKRRTRKGKRTKKSKKNKRMNMKKSNKNRKNKTRGAR